ncbi:hypothetical protein [uncultured Sphingomonas sp.]|uniref:hypothetical protein n=1 Tax=uncultured Sphingomonas sp. TaxID=158754 RepID=UPI0035CC62B0
MLTGISLGLWLAMAMAMADGTPIGRMLHRILVAWPAGRLSRINRGQMLLAILLLTATAGIVWLLEDDGRMLVIMGWPEVMGMAAAIDLSALLDLTLVALVAASTIRVRAVTAWIAARTRPIRRAPRRRRARRAASPPVNDDDEQYPVPFAA